MIRRPLLELVAPRPYCHSQSRVLSTLALLMVLFTLPMSTRVFAQAGPSITISPASGPSGSSVTVSGSDFIGNETIRVNFGNTTVANLRTSVDGTFSGG